MQIGNLEDTVFMLEYIEKRLADGKRDAVLKWYFGGNLKVQIDAVDNIGVLCRVKTMFGDYGEPKCFPWGTIASVSFD